MMHFNPKEFDFQGILYNNELISCEEFKKAIFSLSEYIKTNTKKNRSPFIYLVAENHPKTMIAYFAILQAEFSCVLIDPDWKTLEWEYLLSDTPPSAIIKINQETTFDDFHTDIEFLPDKPDAVFEDKRGYTIVYTAAEDGYAKGALLSQHNILTDALALANIDNANHQDVICPLLPISHLFGLTTGCISPIYSNSKIALIDVKRINQINSISNYIMNYKISHLWTIPIILYLLGNLPEAALTFKSVKYISSGGSKLPKNIYENFLKRFNISIQEGYGLTEASPVCSWHHIGDPVIIESVGRPFPCCTIKIFDDNNNELPIGSLGEICIKGDNVMEGYYKKDNSSVLFDNWLHTGDLGKIDNINQVYLVGLKKNMLNVGGRKVYPNELKRMLLTHNNIADIKLSHTESILTGSKINALITLKNNTIEDQKNFTKWCIQNISAYKLPKSWEFKSEKNY